MLNVLMWSCKYRHIITFDNGIEASMSVALNLYTISMSCLLISSCRVKEIAVGIMANMLCHEKVFLGILDKQRYLEKLLRVLDVKDSPTLSLVFR